MPSDPAISSLIDQLAAPAAEADAAGSKLIALGPAVVAVLVDRFPNAPTPVRRRLAYLLGRYDLANSDAARSGTCGCTGRRWPPPRPRPFWAG